MSENNGFINTHAPLLSSYFSIEKNTQFEKFNDLDKKTIDIANTALNSLQLSPLSDPFADKFITKESLDKKRDFHEFGCKLGFPDAAAFSQGEIDDQSYIEDEIDFDALADELDLLDTTPAKEPMTSSEAAPNGQSYIDDEIDFDALADELDLLDTTPAKEPMTSSEAAPNVQPYIDDEIDFDALANELDLLDTTDISTTNTDISTKNIDDILKEYDELHKKADLSYIHKMIEEDEAKWINFAENFTKTTDATLKSVNLDDFIEISSIWKDTLDNLPIYATSNNQQKYALKEDVERIPELFMNQCHSKIKEKIFTHENNVYMSGGKNNFFEIENYTADQSIINNLSSLSKEKQAAFTNALNSGKIQKTDWKDLEKQIKNKRNAFLKSYFSLHNIQIVQSKNELDKILSKKHEFFLERESTYTLQDIQRSYSNRKKDFDKINLEKRAQLKSDDAVKKRRYDTKKSQIALQEERTAAQRKFYEQMAELEKTRKETLDRVLKEEIARSALIYQFQHALYTKKRKICIKRAFPAA